jgi:hypothetical protein
MKKNRILTLEEVRKRLEPFKLTEVAKATHIDYMRLFQTIKGTRPAYYDDVKKLSDYLEAL